MAKEILLYDYLHDYSCKETIRSMEAAKNEDIKLRINSPGGNVHAGWGVIAKFTEHQKRKQAKVDGMAASMAAMLLCYVDEAECLDVSEFLFHRASYGSYYEKNHMSEQEKTWLNKTNNDLRNAFEAKIDVDRFEATTGVSVDDLFSMESRLDVYLSASQAKDIGLIGKITKITPEKKAEISIMMKAARGEAASPITQKARQENNQNNKLKTRIMDTEQLKREHAALYRQAVEAGVQQERERIGAWMAYLEIDKEAVIDGISAGKDINQKIMAEMTVKGTQMKSLSMIEAAGAPEVETDEELLADPEKTTTQKAIADFKKEVFAELKIMPK